MNIMRCEGGHFFDIETYSVCPHCGAGIAQEKNAKKQGTSEKKKFFWQKEKKKTEPVITVAPDYQEQSLSENNNREAMPEEPVERKEEPEIKSKTDLNAQQNAGVEREKSDSKNATNSLFNVIKAEPEKIETEGNATNSFFNAVNSQESVQSEIKEAEIEEEIEETSLVKEIRNISASSSGKTASYFSTVMAASQSKEGNAEEKKEPLQKEESPVEALEPAVSEPPTGWLVGISGLYFGKYFALEMGKNSIGRNAKENRIALTIDSSVSRVKHAIIIYEPRKRQFFLQPGDESGLCYLNGDLVLTVTELKARDEVEIGTSKFLFVPLCGENFSWDDLGEK